MLFTWLNHTLNNYLAKLNLMYCFILQFRPDVALLSSIALSYSHEKSASGVHEHKSTWGPVKIGASSDGFLKNKKFTLPGAGTPFSFFVYSA